MQSPARFASALLSSLIALLILFSLPTESSAQAYVDRPKLIVIVVIDQFRGDYVERYRTELKGRGFRLFTDEGAWFTDCYYDYANTKTAPGHATIGTGAYTDGHGIESNEWWDAARSYEHRVTSVEDERYRLVGLPASSLPAHRPGAPANAPAFLIGASPRNLRATTLGDELRLATQGRARVFGVSLKDRAAILPAGQAANGAFWTDDASGQFVTSTYYMDSLPAWAQAFNAGGRLAEAAHEAHAEGASHFHDLVERTPAANRYELDFARALIEGEQLGRGPVTDLLTVSLSANDLIGHAKGPDSEEEHQMILGLDRDLDGFFSWLDKTIGLKNVWIALSADHGVAAVPAQAAQLGIDAATPDLGALRTRLNLLLNARFSPQENKNYILVSGDLPYVTLDRRVFEAARIDEKTAEDAAAELLPQALAQLAPPAASALPSEHRLPPTPTVAGVYTRLEMTRGPLPPTELGRLLAHSSFDHGNWYVLLMLGPYQMQDQHSLTGTTHFSPWSYDRHVPLAFYGAPFLPGTYHQRVAPVDLASTLASLAGINQPSAAVGRVVIEALKISHTASEQSVR
jgi:arylsulfatase A-like enzyme